MQHSDQTNICQDSELCKYIFCIKDKGKKRLFQIIVVLLTLYLLQNMTCALSSMFHIGTEFQGLFVGLATALLQVHNLHWALFRHLPLNHASLILFFSFL